MHRKGGGRCVRAPSDYIQDWTRRTLQITYRTAGSRTDAGASLAKRAAGMRRRVHGLDSGARRADARACGCGQRSRLSGLVAHALHPELQPPQNTRAQSTATAADLKDAEKPAPARWGLREREEPAAPQPHPSRGLYPF